VVLPGEHPLFSASRCRNDCCVVIRPPCILQYSLVRSIATICVALDRTEPSNVAQRCRDLQQTQPMRKVRVDSMDSVRLPCSAGLFVRGNTYVRR
jgi:hypothetical protein